MRHRGQSRQRVHRPALTQARFSLPRPSAGLSQHPPGLSLGTNHLRILIPDATHWSPSWGQLQAAGTGAACPSAALQRCPAVPRSSRGEGSAQAAPRARWGRQTEVTR